MAPRHVAHLANVAVITLALEVRVAGPVTAAIVGAGLSVVDVRDVRGVRTRRHAAFVELGGRGDRLAVRAEDAVCDTVIARILGDVARALFVGRVPGVEFANLSNTCGTLRLVEIRPRVLLALQHISRPR